MRRASIFCLLNLLFFCFTWIGCNQSNLSLICEENTCDGTFTDSRDGQTYCTVIIGSQTWMAENMRYDMPNVWTDTTNNYPNYPTSIVDMDTINPNSPNYKYGRFYDWNTAQTVCPNGWHLPTDDEWKILEMSLGMSPNAVDSFFFRGKNEGELLKSAVGWVNGNGLNSVCFNALPVGLYQRVGFGYLNSILAESGTTYFWTSSQTSTSTVIIRALLNWEKKIFRNNFIIYNGACACRCVQN